jgi:hypothetical protein
MLAEARNLERWGYVAVSQNYSPDKWGAGAWIVAFVAMVVLVGIIVLAYMIVTPPAGTLVVTYERRAPDSPAAPIAGKAESVVPARQTARERLRELDALRREGLITEQEFADRRRSIVEGL